MHTFPALHNAMWPGLVGKGPDSEPPIDLDMMLDLTANASVGGVTFDGVDLFLFAPTLTSIPLTRISKLWRKISGSGVLSSVPSSRRCGLPQAAGPPWAPMKIGNVS